MHCTHPRRPQDERKGLGANLAQAPEEDDELCGKRGEPRVLAAGHNHLPFEQTCSWAPSVPAHFLSPHTAASPTAVEVDHLVAVWHVVRLQRVVQQVGNAVDQEREVLVAPQTSEKGKQRIARLRRLCLCALVRLVLDLRLLRREKMGEKRVRWR